MRLSHLTPDRVTAFLAALQAGSVEGAGAASAATSNRYRAAISGLSTYLESGQRRDALQTLRSTLVKDFATFTQTTPFGTTIRVEDGQTKLTPGWKSAMLVLLVLYPTVMLLSRFVGPVFEGLGAGPWLTIWRAAKIVGANLAR